MVGMPAVFYRCRRMKCEEKPLWLHFLSIWCIRIESRCGWKVSSVPWRVACICWCKPDVLNNSRILKSVIDPVNLRSTREMFLLVTLAQRCHVVSKTSIKLRGRWGRSYCLHRVCWYSGVFKINIARPMVRWHLIVQNGLAIGVRKLLRK